MLRKSGHIDLKAYETRGEELRTQRDRKRKRTVIGDFGHYVRNIIGTDVDFSRNFGMELV